MNFPGEKVWISGGIPITPSWSKATAAGPVHFPPSLNVWSTPLDLDKVGKKIIHMIICTICQ